MSAKQRTYLWPLHRFVAGVKRRRKIQKAYNELQSMDDDMLNDIGISRGDIEWIVTGNWHPDRRHRH